MIVVTAGKMTSSIYVQLTNFSELFQNFLTPPHAPSDTFFGLEKCPAIINIQLTNKVSLCVFVKSIDFRVPSQNYALLNDETQN